MSTTTFFTSVEDQLQFVEQRTRSQAGEEHHPDLRSALDHLLAAGGKRIRPTLGLLVGNMLGAPEDKLITLRASVELLHTATLVHDGVVDDANERRGFFSVNALWKNKIAVLVVPAKTQKEIGKSSWFGFAVFGDERAWFTDYESRPIVTGNFLRQPVLKYSDYTVFGETPNADYVDEHGMMIGNSGDPIDWNLD